MKYKVGDRVKFLNEVGGGTISRLIGNNMIELVSEDGFSMPVMISDVIPYLETDEDQIVVKEQIVKSQTNIDPIENYDEFEDSIEDSGTEEELEIDSDDKIMNILFALQPSKQKKESDALDAYLINDSKYKILFNISQKREDFNLNIQAGLIEANTKISIASFTIGDLKCFPEFSFQFIFFKKLFFGFREPAFYTMNVQPMTLLGKDAFKENEYFNDKAHLYSLYIEDFAKEIESIPHTAIAHALKEKEALVKKNIAKPHPRPILKEVDLHIHELVETEAGLSNFDMLKIQMDNFNKELKKAIAEGVKKIVFIHGKGNGRLKLDIRKAIDEKYPNCNYQDASFQEYGFGATLVLIK